MAVISIDVEPGGKSKVLCHIGVAELTGTQMTANFQIAARSPHHGVVRTAHDLLLLNDGYEIPDPRPFEHLPTFAEVWPFLDGFVGDRLASFYSWGYDVSALRKLCDAAGVAPPTWEFFCGLETVKAVFAPERFRYRSLPAVLVALRIIDEEEGVRRAEHHRLHGGGNWVLHNAQEDAWGNALVLRLAAIENRLEPDALPTLPGITRRRFSTA